MREYIYRCDTCKKVLSNPTDKGSSIPHLNLKDASMFFSYFSKKENKWKQEKFNFPCKEHHFCGGKCAGKFVDIFVGITSKLKKNDIS